MIDKINGLCLIKKQFQNSFNIIYEDYQFSCTLWCNFYKTSYNWPLENILVALGTQFGQFLRFCAFHAPTFPHKYIQTYFIMV